MKKLLLLAVFVVGCSSVATAPVVVEPTPAPVEAALSEDYHLPGYSLVWHDEFSDTTLNRNNWCTRFQWGGGIDPVEFPDSYCQPTRHPGHGTLQRVNNEQHFFVDTNPQGRAMHELNNGVVSLLATETRPDPGWNWAKWHAAMLRSKFTFKPTATKDYYVVGRFMLPDVQGTFPAFWLAPYYDEQDALKWPPELDIFEGPVNNDGDNPNLLHQSSILASGITRNIIRKHTKFDTQWMNYVDSASMRNKWLVIAATWTEGGWCASIDGEISYCETYDWNAGPATILVNLSIGGAWAGRKGVDSSGFPTALLVDYVRVYERNYQISSDSAGM